MTPTASRRAILVWDLPVRVVHWALVLLLCFQVFSAWLGGAWMQWHAYSGYSILFLVAFRIAWGFVGTRYARFASFLASPGAVLRTVPAVFKRSAMPYAGHNPLAGWMVVALLASLLLQVGTGLFANDGAGFQGPLASRISIDASASVTFFHRANARVVLLLSAFHVAAAVWHLLFQRDNLFGAMFTGRKSLPFDAPETGDISFKRLLAALCVGLLIVYVVLGAAL